ncbi:benzoyl-CoA reductase/2-hydroxyglutaryl-CoA dehydratase subunit BcrC/BadD/HgdB [Streptosporangium becharense]|uniref:Benzoyl-CoA reductase/2-hydroxyglutaryl-CoA dehydratase subunit BcrC/BadD/HgdB n=1 Tax=Streptosporangium becharense TaxID=1816182 RepID=A0A7W9IAD3_9ACTN|nr:2-hydroxyacyl-CoA dehydratase family protein [Streptosporangium becharense]MBB2914060.1 benzoyl-CoA reductase/2-hydroxyglutaryl-CoA dehydratase subunit BcrC/BadD/HgdB [Streptosporangium becharense]MBB5817087.1 benzoyl-CoA reductase/2-hydroxyglutaryl-CoA dehydratase subunit BcrC/BadD/HgdB [Streptosporangium becharense]
MIAALVGADIPSALVRACGLEPRRIGLCEAENALQDPDVACVVFSHLRACYAQAYHRWYAELRDVRKTPELVLLDLPMTEGPGARAYALARLRQAGDRLSPLTGVRLDEAALLRELRAAVEPSGTTGTVPDSRSPRAVIVGAEEVPDSVYRVTGAGLTVVATEGPAGYGSGAGADAETAGTDPWKILLDRHFARASTTSKASLIRRAEALRALASRAGADTVVFAADPLDDAAAWLRALLLRADAAPRVTTLPELESGGVRPTPQESPAVVAGKRSTPSTSSAARTGREGGRSRKSLAVISTFGAYQREWFASIRSRAAAGEPFAVVNADTPQEILRALDIPFVVNQWWASIVAAKQATPRFRRALAEHGFPTDNEAYSSQGLAALFVPDEEAPWGGLPRPSLLQTVRSEDALVGIFEQWAEAGGADLITFDRSAETRREFPLTWWDDLPDRWEETLEPERLDLMTAQIRESIAVIERRTGRRLDPERLTSVLHLVNEQEEYYRRIRDLVAATSPAPVSIADTMPATMIPQWHRGTEWGRDAARDLHAEVARRVDRGEAVCARERVRVMWVGRGTWQNMRLYQAFGESHGAVFVWSMYLGLAADGYLRYFDRGRDPLRSLAARFLTMGDELRMPSWSAAWHVAEARRHRVDAVVGIADAEPHVLDELEREGLPVLRIRADNLSLDGGGPAEHRIGAFLDEHFGRLR